MNRKGFSLIELVIVVAIIGILAVIAIPGYLGQQKSAARTEAYTNLQNLALLEAQYFADQGRYVPDPDGTFAYKATPNTSDGGLEDVLKGFKPGGCSADPPNTPPCNSPFGLGFTYSITTSANGTAFVATARGVAPRVNGDVFTIDNNNIKNF